MVPETILGVYGLSHMRVQPFHAPDRSGVGGGIPGGLMPSFFSATSALLLVFCSGTTMGMNELRAGDGPDRLGALIERPYSGDDRQRSNVDQNGNDPAYQAGYQKDARKSKRNPNVTKSEHYEDTPGYNSYFGSKDQFVLWEQGPMESGVQAGVCCRVPADMGWVRATLLIAEEQVYKLL